MDMILLPPTFHCLPFAGAVLRGFHADFFDPVAVVFRNVIGYNFLTLSPSLIHRLCGWAEKYVKSKYMYLESNPECPPGGQITYTIRFFNIWLCNRSKTAGILN